MLQEKKTLSKNKDNSLSYAIRLILRSLIIQTMIKSHVDPHNINIVWITLPSKDGWENRSFLQKYGINVLRGDSTFFPAIRTGALLKHESGIVCKVREVVVQYCGNGSSCSRVIIKATNTSCDKKKFQEVFYDFFGNLLK